MTSLNIHAGCRGPLALDVDPSGWFWDTGIRAMPYSGGDRWSTDVVIGHSVEGGPSPDVVHERAATTTRVFEGIS